ncbi:carboxypeptidase-like regulatory domain-containing protein [Aquimarina sp. 2201CG5-10]|uniref:carboxypeptidase-like regulatory domain-containing protein n=1 Tax=Aquimarina callyspongiae TaxID=3098150 RepID=UPI002AB3D1C8|nr:carboxypeptidase-like regulatory domain-containing protein [Aquimarina sp. 2201CG5-10]MDY8135255.1 TonB-dependent receptor [Aquimarina sp. 2201CG5-10]
MKNQLHKLPLLFVLLLFSIQVSSQEGTVTGVLTDNQGLPLPGVNIIVKGTTTGTQTDFDGNYSINCSTGDTLVFSYVGFDNKEVLVTAEMFGQKGAMAIIKKEAVQPIKHKAYTEALKRSDKDKIVVPSLEDSFTTFNKVNNTFPYNRIKNIQVKKDKVQLTYFSPDIFFETGVSLTTEFRFVQNKNLPLLQKTYAQGRPFNGQNTFFGAETGETFSYGPRLLSLEFDGNTYPYDSNGSLVPIGAGSGKSAIPYDNTIFETSVTNTSSLFFNVTTDSNLFEFNYKNKTQEGIFGRQTSYLNDFSLEYRNPKNAYKTVIWDTFLKYTNSSDNQPNINGFHNNLLLNNWATPISFDNSQGSVLSDNTQRSFSPDRFNNPDWLLQNNRNRVKNTSFIASIQNKIRVSNDIYFKTALSYRNSVNTQRFGVVKNTTGFSEGYRSDKKIQEDNFNTSVLFKLEKYLDDSKIELASNTNFTHKRLKYSLSEGFGLEDFTFQNALLQTNRNVDLQRNTLRLFNKLSYTIADWKTTVSIANSSFVSSIQKNEWFLPTLQVKLDLENIFDIYGLNYFTVSASTAYDVNKTSLFYKNQSHNSLLFSPEESLGYLANQDLFVTNELKLEKKKNYELSANLDFDLFYGDLDVQLGFTYYNSTTDNSVFPVYDQNQFQLRNIADIRNRGFEFDLSLPVYNNNGFTYIPKLIFTSYRTKVLKIHASEETIPIAGFSSVSKNLIKDQPAGVIVGTAFARDSQNNIIIDNQGFPLVANERKVIGDPTPDYTIGFSNTFNWKRIHLDFLIDYQKGGDVWNGTQNVLNYLGTSQQSADQRSITSFVFDGVNTSGIPNSIPVDFANPINGISENRFVRYGFEGVAEEAIEDGSYINLKSINLSYLLKKDRDNHFIRELDIGIYGNNLFTWTRYRGASPYSSLFGHSSGQGLHFFNTPITSEIGIKINIKI